MNFFMSALFAYSCASNKKRRKQFLNLFGERQTIRENLFVKKSKECKKNSANNNVSNDHDRKH